MILQKTIIPVQHHKAELLLAEAVADLDRERKAVGEIQRSLLPASMPEIPGFELTPYYRPSEHASGDYYDVVPLIDGQWGFVMADVSGHGTPAAVIMAVMRTLIHAELPNNRNKSAGEFLEHVNRVMSETYLRNGLFVTVWAAVLAPNTRRLSYASAGHNPPRLLRGGRVFSLDTASGLPLGIEPEVTYQENSITLQPEDLVVIYTDGITEAMRSTTENRELFGTERLDRVISKCCGSDPTSECMDRVMQAIATFTHDEAPTDDRTMLVLRANGSVSTNLQATQSAQHHPHQMFDRHRYEVECLSCLAINDGLEPTSSLPTGGSVRNTVTFMENDNEPLDFRRSARSRDRRSYGGPT